MNEILHKGSIVKMNPFRIKQAKDEHLSDEFDGESEIVRINVDNGHGYVMKANWWRREDLLIKGVDYDVDEC